MKFSRHYHDTRSSYLHGWLIIHQNFHYNGDAVSCMLLKVKHFKIYLDNVHYAFISNNCVCIIHHLLHNHHGCMNKWLAFSSSAAFIFEYFIFFSLFHFDVSTLCPRVCIMRKIVCIVGELENFNADASCMPKLHYYFVCMLQKCNFEAVELWINMTQWVLKTFFNHRLSPSQTRL